MKFNKISEEQFKSDGVDKYCNYSDIKLPKRATRLSAGYDIFCLSDLTLSPGETVLMPTGIQIVLDEDKALLILPRSGLGFKYRTQLWNTVGLIDADYHYSHNEGHMWVKMINESDKVLNIKAGEAFCQAVIIQYFKVDDDEASATRDGGFGSTSGSLNI